MRNRLKPIIAVVLILSMVIIMPTGSRGEDLFAVSYTTYDTTYDAIVDMYIRVLNAYGTGKTGRHDLFNDLIISDFNHDYESSMAHRIDSAKKRVGVCQYDLNGDGIDELIIGENPSYVYEVFTMDNGKVRELIRAGYKYDCTLLKNGRFYREERLGADWYSYTVWRMNGTGKVAFHEGYLLDEQTAFLLYPKGRVETLWFKMNGPKMKLGTGETAVDSNDFLAWLKRIDEDVLQLQFIPLSFFEQDKAADYEKLGIVSVNGKTSGNTTVRVRSKPDKKSKVIKNCKVGTCLEILGEEDGYYRIKTGKQEGYIQKEYLVSLKDSAPGKRYGVDYEDFEKYVKLMLEEAQVNWYNSNNWSGYQTTDQPTKTENDEANEKESMVVDHYETVEIQRSRQVLDHYETYYTYEDDGSGSFAEISHQRPVHTTEYYTEIKQRPVYRTEGN